MGKAGLLLQPNGARLPRLFWVVSCGWAVEVVVCAASGESATKRSRGVIRGMGHLVAGAVAAGYRLSQPRHPPVRRGVRTRATDAGARHRKRRPGDRGQTDARAPRAALRNDARMLAFATAALLSAPQQPFDHW